ncbi:RNA polymerase sigma-54 factor (plasmid) [Gemmobacter fulvus]|uniref:RNA polymerase sigma-54 factor n=1 Tax=Gemmobacter fulvus TaxID=2840474 RepID=A0A975PCN6_9RHOB|nr:RNA polymerase sigma-54 factor [Gemmobacter fulvus]MBT9246609.1 RNA polymerase sigma-54 factor [Gemmobacter fulvus]QWK92696.1 RNA polymerase sigma-54 factor [Gemmobacter fulvus]
MTQSPRHSLAARQTQGLRQHLSARQLQAIALLHLTNDGLMVHLQRRAEVNPMLRLRGGPSVMTEPGGAEAEQPQSAPGLQDHVLRQIRLMISDSASLTLAMAFIEALDANGWLDRPLPEIATAAGRSLPEARALLARLQQVEPAGLFARDLRECLALQAEDRGQLSPAMLAVLARLPLLATGGLRAVAEAAGLRPEEVQLCLGQIRRMNPKPGAAFGNDAPPLREPDLIVTQAPEGWRVDLNRSTLPAILLPPRSPAPDAKLRAARAEAEWLANVLERRNRTVLAVATEVLRRQQGFLDQGPGSLIALRQAEVAAALSLHDSTISRVSRHLLVATPHGMRSLCSFFDAAPLAARHLDLAPSSAAIRHRLRQIIAGENPAAPLSDAALATALWREGKPLARRTVAKFRHELGIPPMLSRRRPRAATAEA